MLCVNDRSSFPVLSTSCPFSTVGPADASSVLCPLSPNAGYWQEIVCKAEWQRAPKATCPVAAAMAEVTPLA